MSEDKFSVIFILVQFKLLIRTLFSNLISDLLSKSLPIKDLTPLVTIKILGDISTFLHTILASNSSIGLTIHPLYMFNLIDVELNDRFPKFSLKIYSDNTEISAPESILIVRGMSLIFTLFKKGLNTLFDKVNIPIRSGILSSVVWAKLLPLLFLEIYAK